VDPTVSRIELPTRPDALAGRSVAAWAQDVQIDSYAVGEPSKYPEFLSSRVFQGSSGAVFPLPFFEHIAHTKAPRAWQAVHLENEYVRLMILPQLGGRIHIGQDLTNGYDFFYRNNVIKPALVGLTGPWISGGVEFNWPQHHRPATFLPTEYEIEEEPDGSVTVWCSDHDPMMRMKGMHGVRLRPRSSLIELRVRLFNRTEDVQTFLWWSNAAVRVGDDYQSFFPTDVTIVADHAKRATATFPKVNGRYYGVDYRARVDAAHPDADRIDWYRNIPVPTSYMIVGTHQDFLGGYDHDAQSGFVYWADHRIAPGKKLWTWGNAPFGWSWDRHLTDTDGPYVELMAGAFTDNQPDFSYLVPGETKTFSQFWYPIQRIGPVQAATLDAATALDVVDGAVRVGVCTTTPRTGVRLTLADATGLKVWEAVADIAPGRPYLATVPLVGLGGTRPLALTVLHNGSQLASFAWSPPTEAPLMREDELPVLATPIPTPETIESVEELYLSARHLEQYRHATRSPEPYLAEALRRDPDHAPSLTMLSARRYRAGLYEEAREYAAHALARLTKRNPNPVDGEGHYRLGLALRRLGRKDDAAVALVKASWDARWRAPALGLVAADELAADRVTEAEQHLRLTLPLAADNTRLRNLLVICWRRLGRTVDADRLLAETRALDPLDWWAIDLAGEPVAAEPQTVLDLVGEYLAIGERRAALRLATLAAERASAADPGLVGAVPLAHYYRARILHELGDAAGARAALTLAAAVDRGVCQLSRLDDYDVVSWVLLTNPLDANAQALLGNWLYHWRRSAAAVEHWQTAVELDPADAVSWRNLGVAAWNVAHDPRRACECYERAAGLRPFDAKLAYEFDQLKARVGVPVATRLADLHRIPLLVAQRDDLSTVCAELSTLVGDPAAAVELLCSREFGPWEGGEGGVLGAWDRAHYVLAHRASLAGNPEGAIAQLDAALSPPKSLGEARHLLANASDLWLALGDALAAGGRLDEAEPWWRRAAYFEGDFQGMQVLPYSDLTYYSVRALRRLGEKAVADRLLEGFATYIEQESKISPEIDYFVTSLPTMLLFTEDLNEVHTRRLLLLRAQLADLRGETSEATALLHELVQRDPSNARAGVWALTRTDAPESDALRPMA
jgi:tetratricopeptide (TPR) repeat protein